jgi:hypothetical protein
MNKLQYDQLQKVAGDSTPDFMVKYNLDVDITPTPDYELKAWFTADRSLFDKSLLRKRNVGDAWDIFYSLQLDFKRRYFDWLNKWANIYRADEDLVQRKATLSTAQSKLTKPIYQYATARGSRKYSSPVAESYYWAEKHYRGSIEVREALNNIPDNVPAPDMELFKALANFKYLYEDRQQREEILAKKVRKPREKVAPKALSAHRDTSATILKSLLKDLDGYILVGDFAIHRKPLYDYITAMGSGSISLSIKDEHFVLQSIYGTARFKAQKYDGPDVNELKILG